MGRCSLYWGRRGVHSHVFLDAMNSLFASLVYATYGGMVADRKFEAGGHFS